MQNKLTISRVVAPAYSKEALEILSKKKGGKFLVSPAQDVISSLKFGIRILMFCRYYKWTSSTNPHPSKRAMCTVYPFNSIATTSKSHPKKPSARSSRQRTLLYFQSQHCEISLLPPLRSNTPKAIPSAMLSMVKVCRLSPESVLELLVK